MIEQIAPMDRVYMLGFFMALALRRGRVDSMIGGMMKWFPNEDNPTVGPGKDGKTTTTKTDFQGGEK